MKENIIKTSKDYQQLIGNITTVYTDGRLKAIQAVNATLLKSYWQIGQHIIEFEQGGAERAKYGAQLLSVLSKDLSLLHGKGFSLSNLKLMRQLYVCYSKSQTVSDQLGWSHYVELLKLDDELERSFYEKQSIRERWSVRELKRQISSSLFLRLATVKDKEQILHLAKQGQTVTHPLDIIRDPYILDFLKIPEPNHYSESELEKRIIEHLQHFLLELGKGFAFVGRQYRITLDNTHHYVDLVFYHRILKCFVLIDLKKERAGYEDIGQMNMYLGYFEHEENTEGDAPPIGIILAKQKDDLLIKYAMHNISSQLFVSKYQLYLPDKEELRAVIEEQLNSNQ
ncbi:YhcG family protein [Mucilaginibacter ximonensis]|uniref:YhcG family protein n=1 Tax=Mucilaginibacter ximonensis TaxID=538021 RepID=A0ABW5Y9D9_9SPHI